MFFAKCLNLNGCSSNAAFLIVCIGLSSVQWCHCKGGDDHGDNVELDKSNVLLMGPTGSGNFIFLTYTSMFVILCNENILLRL